MTKNQIVQRVKREVIQGKLLAALEQDDRVAVLLTQHELSNLICALGDWISQPVNPILRKKIREFRDDLVRLQDEAYPPPSGK